MIHWCFILKTTHFVKFSFSSMLGWGSSHTFDGGTSHIWCESTVASLIIHITIFILDVSLFSYTLLFQTVLIVIPPISETVLHIFGKKTFPQESCSTAQFVSLEIIITSIHILNTYILTYIALKLVWRYCLGIMCDLGMISRPYFKQVDTWSMTEDTEATKMINVK